MSIEVYAYDTTLADETAVIVKSFCMTGPNQGVTTTLKISVDELDKALDKYHGGNGLFNSRDNGAGFYLVWKIKTDSADLSFDYDRSSNMFFNLTPEDNHGVLQVHFKKSRIE